MAVGGIPNITYTQPGVTGLENEGTPRPDIIPHTDLEEVKGYPVSVLGEEVDTKFLCSQCELVIRDPVQSPCGHRFCKTCLNKLSEQLHPTCNLCKADGDDGVIHRDADGQVMTFPDRAIMREMRRLPARCHHEGCQWKGSFGDFLDHEVTCKHRPVTCEECGATLSRYKIKEHHDPETGDCSKVKCPFGCKQNSTNEHLSADIVEHSLILLDKINQIRTITKDGHHDTGDHLEGRLGVLEGKVNDLQENKRQLLEGDGGHHSGYKELEEKHVTLESLAAVLNREMEKIITQVGALEHHRTLDLYNADTMGKKIRALERSLALKDVALAETQSRLDTLENTSYDGTYIWRITDFRRRRQDAINGRTLSIYSPPFHTGKAGYKVCARIYLNGDGMGNGTHLSLFFVIFRGDFDPILVWPFPHKVTFTLLDQTGKEHLVNGFRPDPASSSFKRPTSDMNIASGMPLFCPLNKIDHPNSPYTKEDTMFIRMKVFCDNSD